MVMRGNIWNYDLNIVLIRVVNIYIYIFTQTYNKYMYQILPVSFDFIIAQKR